MQKIKCVHIITMLELGGAQDNTLFTVENLDPGRYDKYLICGPGGILDQEAKVNTAFKTIFVKALKRKISPFSDAAALIRIFFILKKIKPDIVHTHSSKAGIIGRWAAFFAGVPLTIHTFHGFGFNKFQKKLARDVLAFAEKLTSKITDSFVAVSSDNVEYARSNGIGIGKRIEVIHSGIRKKEPSDDFDLNRIMPFSKCDKLIVNISCLKPQKNPLHFVEVANIIVNERKNSGAKFMLIGDGELKGAVSEAVMKYSLEKNFYLAGWRRDAYEILSRADVFMLTSLWEGLPRAMVEAMYYSKPVLGYNVDGINEILKDGRNGFIVPAKDFRLLAQKLDYLLNNQQEAVLMGNAGRSGLDDSFFIDNMVKSIDKYYSGLTKF